MDRYDLGVVFVALGGIYLIYQSVISVILGFIQLSFGVESVFDIFLALGPAFAIAAVGIVLLRGRFSIAGSLFGRGSVPPTDSDWTGLTLENVVTLAGLFFFVTGLLGIGEITTEWIAGNVSSQPLPEPIEAWPRRVSAVIGFLVGYVLLFHSPAVTSWLRVQRNRRFIE